VLDKAKGLEWLGKAGELGNKEALQDLVDIYGRLERHVDRDAATQIYWLEKLVETGDSQAAVQVAGMYLFVTKGEAGAKESTKWLQHASKLGHSSASAQHKLIEWTKDSSQSKTIGFALLDKVWNDGNQWLYLLFLAELKDPTTSRSTATAPRGYHLIHEYIQKRNERLWPNDPTGTLQCTLLRGYGYSLCFPHDLDSADIRKGMEYLEQAIEMGDGMSAYTLANLYSGDYPEIASDDEKLEHWLTKSANPGCSQGTFDLAEVYYTHSNKPTHAWLAKKWSKRVAGLECTH